MVCRILAALCSSVATCPVSLVIRIANVLLEAVQVVAAEPNLYRHTLAERLGAAGMRAAEDVVRDFAGRRVGVSMQFEISGAPETLTTLFEAVRCERPTAAHSKRGVASRGIFCRGEACKVLIKSALRYIA